MTRQNRVPLGGTSAAPVFGFALIPLWDMINHEDGRVTSAYDFEAKVTEFNAMRSFSAGEQIRMFYGARSNAELLLHSGFVMPNNRYDYLVIKLGVGSQDALGPLKARLLEALTIPRLDS